MSGSVWNNRRFHEMLNTATQVWIVAIGHTSGDWGWSWWGPYYGDFS